MAHRVSAQCFNAPLFRQLGSPQSRVDELNYQGNILIHEGDFGGAVACYKEAIKIQKSIYGDPSIEVVHALNEMGNFLNTLGQFHPAADCYKEALAMQKDLDGSRPSPEVAYALGNLGGFLRSLSRFDEAVVYYKEAVEMQMGLYGSRPSPEIAYALDNLGSLLSFLGRFNEAVVYCEKALEMQIKLDGSHPSHAVACSLNTLGDVQCHLGHFNRGLECYTQALAIKKATPFPFPDEAVARILNNQGHALKQLGRFEEALQVLTQALLKQNEVHCFNPSPEVKAGIAQILNNKGDVLEELGQFKSAWDTYKEVLARKKAIGGPAFKNEEVHILNKIGNILRLNGYFGRGLRHHQKALDAWEKSRSLTSERDHLGALIRKSECLSYVGKFRAALEIQFENSEKIQAIYGQTHFRTANYLHHTAVCLYSVGEYETALTFYRKALDIYEQVYGPDHPEVAAALNNQANCLAALEKIGEALETQNRALTIRERVYGKEHPSVATSLSNKGSYLFSLKKFEEAQTAYEQCLQTRMKFFDKKNPIIALTSICIDICLKALGKKRETIGEKIDQNGLLNNKNFEFLINYSMSYLETNDKLIIEKNPGEFRVRVPSKPWFPGSNQIENLYLSYSPTEVKMSDREPMYDHPQKFITMVVQGSYTEAIYEQSENDPDSQLFRVDRIVRSLTDINEGKPDERNVFCLDPVKLKYLRTHSKGPGSITASSPSLISQITETESKTLTITAVFKKEGNSAYVDVYRPLNSQVNSQDGLSRKREFLTLKERDNIRAQIKKILYEWMSHN
jgi:tetratricopeptide (TPR) repeat protein